MKNVDHKPERASPVSRERAAAALAADCGLSEEDCAVALRNALIGFSTPENLRGVPDGNGEPLLAFKLHQFIAGAGRLYATLHPEGQRDVTVSGQIFNPNNEEERLYPVHFCRNCGQEFHPVTLRTDRGREYFEKREIDDIPVEADEEDEGAEWGFLMPEPADPEFTFGGDDEDYPEAWLEETKRGGRRLKSTYRKRRACLHEVAPSGNCGMGHRSWFMPGKFRFCPVCKDVSNTSARDINKLASLSGEGRSSATTILISSILQWMNGDASDLPEHTRKLLAFTDNRQDAALQAGHFNDFIFVTLLRAAILSALKSAPAGSLPEPEIGARIQVALGFLADGAYAHRADEWLENPGLKGQAREDAEAVLREGLQHRFWIDQRRGWRFTNPNLEQLGLVRAEYQYIEDLARDDEELYHRAECLTHVGDSQAVRSLTQCGEPMRFAMAAPIDLRNDFDSVSLRRLAKRTRDATQSRRLLALAEVYDGGSRTDASRIGGVGLQIIRDWVLRFNARGLDGLVDGKSPGAPSKLNADHRRALAEVVEAGPVPAVDGVVRWRRKDLARWLLETFAISLDETTVGRELKALGFAKISARPRHYAQNELAVEAFKKNFPAELAKIRARLPKGVEIELWWQDEARIGQKNKLTRRWARRGTRPRAPRDQRTEWAYIFGAICPAKGKGAGLVMPWCDTDAMAAHLIEISAAVDPGAQAVLIVDQAGWHLTPKLAIPDNITVLALPPRSPELNPVENVWQFMRDNWLSNRIFKSYEDIVALCCQAWNNLIDQPWKIMSLGMRKWAHGF